MGAAGTGAGVGAGAGALAGAGVGSVIPGVGTLIGALAGGVYGAVGGGALGAAVPRTFTDVGGQKYAAGEAKTAAADQASQAASLEQKILEQPKQISPDNFLANKNRMLKNMRLGLASTITNGAGTPSPVLSAPSLSGSMGNNKLGS